MLRQRRHDGDSQREQQQRSKTRFTGAVSTESLVVELQWECFFKPHSSCPAKRMRDINEEINDLGVREPELPLITTTNYQHSSCGTCQRNAARRETRGSRKPSSVRIAIEAQASLSENQTSTKRTPPRTICRQRCAETSGCLSLNRRRYRNNLRSMCSECGTPHQVFAMTCTNLLRGTTTRLVGP